ncbi:Outer membrane usher protein HtrE [compost metagenome]
MRVNKKSHALPFRLNPLSVILLSLISSDGGWAAMSTDTASMVAEVQFNDAFLMRSAGEHIDIDRFSKGNIAAPGTYRVDLLVNRQWVGRGEVTLRPVGADNGNVQPCFDVALLERLGVDLSRLAVAAAARLQKGAGATCVTLPELVPDATADFDNGEQRLDVSVPQAAMNRQARGYVDPQYWDDGETAALLNYNGNLYRTENQGLSSTQGYLGLNAGLNAGPWRLRHAGNFSYDDVRGNEYQDIQTSLQRSIAPLKSQLVVGEAFTDGALFDSVGFTGAQLASDDRMYPESQRGYAPVIRGIAQTNARVQVRQNGNIIYETTVAPGAFVIDDLYPTGYGGDLDVVVTEADGQVNVSRVPFAAAVNALRPGVTRYSLTAGEYRNPGVDSKPALLQGTVQHGFTNLLTGYGGVQLADDYSSAMAGLALNTDYGAFGFDIAQANTKLDGQADRSGQSIRLSYSKLIEPTDTNVSLAAYRYSTSGYLSLADAVVLRDMDERNFGFAARGTQRGRLQAMVNQSLAPGYGSLYLSGSTQDYWDRDGRDTQYQIGYSNHFRNVTYGISASRQFNLNAREWDNQVMLNFSFPLGSGAHAPRSTTYVQNSSTGSSGVRETLSGALGADNAFAYGVNAGYNRSDGAGSTSDVGANASYLAPMVRLSGSVSRGEGYSQVGAGISGGVVAYSGGVAFTPTMGETVAIVEARDAHGARIRNGNGLRVDRQGHALVANLVPFSRNEIEIDPKGLPMSVELKSTQEHTAPTAGAVVRVTFATDNPGRAAVIRTKTSDGKPLPFAAEVFDVSGQQVGMVAQGGRIIARGLKNDNGQLIAKWGEDSDATCRLDYALPRLAEEGHAEKLVIVDSKCN